MNLLNIEVESSVDTWGEVESSVDTSIISFWNKIIC